MTEAQNGSLRVLVGTTPVHISSAHYRTTGGVIIEPPVIINKFNFSTYAAIGGSLGAFLVITILVTVTLVVIAYFYRRLVKMTS